MGFSAHYVIKSTLAAASGSFNDVLIVCVPHHLTKTGGDHTMRDYGAHFKFETYLDKEGAKRHYSCYAQFQLKGMPNKAAYQPTATYRCGGRSRSGDKAFSSLTQLPCYITYNGNTIVQKKLEAPHEHAYVAADLTEARRQLQ